MSRLQFLGCKYKSFKLDGTINASGTIAFYVADGTYSTFKSTYSDSSLGVANSNTITLDSAGEATIWLDGDYDVKEYDSSGTLLRSRLSLNPTSITTAFSISLSTTLTATHAASFIEATGSIALTLTSAATLGAGWYVIVKNVGSGIVTISRANAANTIDGSAADITIAAKDSKIISVITATTGFITTGSNELSSLLTTTGDLVYASAANIPTRLAIGAAGSMLQVNPAGTGYTAWAGPRGYLCGLIISSDSATVMGITVGECLDSTNAYMFKLTSTFTKTLATTWAAGTGTNGLFTGSPGNNTWYHAFLIRKDSDGTIDVGFDTSVTAANKPTGYTYYRRIGSILTNGSAQILSFTQIGNDFIWAAAIADASNVSVASTSTTRTLSTPLGIRTRARVSYVPGGTSGTIYVRSLDVTDIAVATTGPGNIASSGNPIASEIDVWTNTSSQIADRASTAIINSYIYTHGWMDLRGTLS